MKFASYLVKGQPSYGVIREDGSVVDLRSRIGQDFPSLLVLLQCGAISVAREAAEVLVVPGGRDGGEDAGGRVGARGVGLASCSSGAAAEAGGSGAEQRDRAAAVGPDALLASSSFDLFVLVVAAAAGSGGGRHRARDRKPSPPDADSAADAPLPPALLAAAAGLRHAAARLASGRMLSRLRLPSR